MMQVVEKSRVENVSINLTVYLYVLCLQVMYSKSFLASSSDWFHYMMNCCYLLFLLRGSVMPNSFRISSSLVTMISYSSSSS